MGHDDFNLWFQRVAQICIMAAILLLILGILGQFDYEEARLRECAAKGLAYNPQQDRCYGPPQKN